MSSPTGGRQAVSHARYEQLLHELSDAQERVRAFRESNGSSGWSDAAAGAQINAAVSPLINRVLDLEHLLRAVIPVDDDELRRRNAPAPATVDELLLHAETGAAMFRIELWDDRGSVTQLPFPDGPLDPEPLAAELTQSGARGELRIVRIRQQGHPEEIVFRRELV